MIKLHNQMSFDQENIEEYMNLLKEIRGDDENPKMVNKSFLATEKNVEEINKHKKLFL